MAKRDVHKEWLKTIIDSCRCPYCNGTGRNMPQWVTIQSLIVPVVKRKPAKKNGRMTNDDHNHR